MGKSFNRSLGITSLFLILITPAMARNALTSFPGGLIYGSDDRVEIDDYPEVEFIEKAKSVAMRVSKKRLTTDRNDNNRVLFSNISLRSARPAMCKNERFLDQTSLGSCSGFLMGPKTLVTAGHCMINQLDCDNNKWVFGFKEGVTELTSSQVYSCKKIVAQKYIYSKKEMSDYAVIELDRAVEDYTPLKRRKHGRAMINTPLLVIGHPMGLPMKATDGGVVSGLNANERENKLRSYMLRVNYFMTNLDSYGGNSGSPVFNKKNGQVEGILVQGADDFVYNPKRDCLESKRLTNKTRDAYEQVMRINEVPGLPD